MTNVPLFTSSAMSVDPAWIDYNGHMNMAYYNVLFDRGSDQAFARMGLGPDYAKSRKLTVYTAENHVCYVRELHVGDNVTASLRLVDHDEKRLHFYQELHHIDGWLAATAEALTLHIDMTGPRVTPFPDDIAALVATFAKSGAHLAIPSRVGRSIGIPRA